MSTTPADVAAQASIAGSTLAPVQITMFGGTDIHSPTVVNEYSALSIPAFYSAVRYLSETLAGLPKAVFQKTGRICQPQGHRLNKILQRKTNPLSTPTVVWETFFHHAIIWGNGYLWVRRDSLGQPVELYNLNPERVTPFRYTDDQGSVTQWYAISKSPKECTIAPNDDVIHVPGLGFDGLSGYPIVWLLAETLDYARNIQRYGARYLKRGTHVQGSIEIPGNASKEQIDGMIDRLKRAHSGMDSDYGFTVLTGGATMKNNTVPPQQSQLIETMGASVMDLCRLLRVSPIKVYEYGRATWGNSETMALEDIKYSLRPWIIKSEEQLSGKLLTENEQDNGLFIECDIDDLLRGDSVTTAAMLASKVNTGLITVNEARAMDNLPPSTDPEADKLRVPVSFPIPGVTNAPASGPTEPEAPRQNNSQAAATRQAFDMVLQQAIQRVEAKTAKAFDAKASKPADERTIWANVFAEQQKSYVIQELTAPLEALRLIDGTTMDLAAIGEKYAYAIRQKAAKRS